MATVMEGLLVLESDCSLTLELDQRRRGDIRKGGKE
jgi:hypothetical protein